METSGTSKAPLRIFYEPWCGFCSAALRLARKKGVEFEAVDLSGDRAQRQALTEQTNHHTIPYIFVGETFVGGYTELWALERRGELDRMLAEADASKA